MNRINITIPQGIACDVTGFLYSSQDYQELGEDMLEVCLENGILIDAGWYPHGSPQGTYVVSASRGLDLYATEQTKSVRAAATLVEEFIRTYGRPWLQLAESNTKIDRFCV